MDDDENVPTDHFDRTCEVVALDDGDREVRCGRVAVERVHSWWMCRRCLPRPLGVRQATTTVAAGSATDLVGTTRVLSDT